MHDQLCVVVFSSVGATLRNEWNYCIPAALDSLISSLIVESLVPSSKNPIIIHDPYRSISHSFLIFVGRPKVKSGHLVSAWGSVLALIKVPETSESMILATSNLLTFGKQLSNVVLLAFFYAVYFTKKKKKKQNRKMIQGPLCRLLSFPPAVLSQGTWRLWWEVHKNTEWL